MARIIDFITHWTDILCEAQRETMLKSYGLEKLIHNSEESLKK